MALPSFVLYVSAVVGCLLELSELNTAELFGCYLASAVKTVQAGLKNKITEIKENPIDDDLNSD